MTNLKYLENTYLFESKASILEIWENDFWKYIILDETIFYPQWWGQPSDEWDIINENWEFFTNNVRLDENWIVYHYWDFKNWNLKVWESVNLKINSEKRIINTKNHSAWHLIDIAVENIWITNIEPTKWFHFPQWSYVEYNWIIEEEREVIIQKLNNELKNLILKDINIKIEIPDEKENIQSPKWKKARICIIHKITGNRLNKKRVDKY